MDLTALHDMRLRLHGSGAHAPSSLTHPAYSPLDTAHVR
jgi:hypothetical protein